LQSHGWKEIAGQLWEGGEKATLSMSPSWGKFGLASVTEPGGKLLEKFQEEHTNFRQERGSGGESRCGDLEAAPVC